MAKKDGFKLPKRVAGVKIPKVIRKGALGHFLKSSAGQLVIAETLVAAAAAFTAVKADEDSAVGETVRHPVDTARRVGHALTSAGASENERLAHAFRAAAQAFRDALRDDGEFAVWKEELAEGDMGKAQKKSRSRADARLH